MKSDFYDIAWMIGMLAMFAYTFYHLARWFQDYTRPLLNALGGVA